MEGAREAATHIVGNSPRARHVQRLIQKVGQGRWPVLLLGETGTGKEVAARAIHNVSTGGPFITIDCSSVVAPLMESELFGYAKGSFTGAVQAKTGLIELADGGTAFFDEIGELPLDLQCKLLRVLQEKEFRPIGSLSQKRSEFRIIAATNRELAQEVERGAFRRDLYYRLNVVSMRMAPLRERREDIAPLLDHFLARHGTGHKLTDEVLEALHYYDWPGNIRELDNCVQHLVAVNSGPLIHLADLPSGVRNQMGAKTRAMAAGAAVPLTPRAAHVQASVPLPACPVLPLSVVERQAILQAIAYTKGDRMMAAHLLGIGRTTLYRKLKEYHLDGEV